MFQCYPRCAMPSAVSRCHLWRRWANCGVGRTNVQEFLKIMSSRSALWIVCGLLAAGAVLLPGVANAQAMPISIDSGQRGEDARETAVNGFNFVLNDVGQHDSSTGWSDIVNPMLEFRFNRHFSLTASTPWYPFLSAYLPKTVAGVTTYTLAEGHSVLGDTAVSGTYELEHKDFSYEAIGILGFATGNSRYGLSANQTTYNLTSHADYSLGRFDPEIEIGEGDSSGLVNRAVKKPYVAVGALANFEVGTAVDLPFSMNLDLDAYEDLPIGSQNVYGTVTRKNKKGKTVTRQVLQGMGVAEDNGFMAELDIPFARHFQLIGTYQRSLVQGLDTASVGLTWTLRRAKIRARVDAR
jgi:hypothetical protein